MSAQPNDSEDPEKWDENYTGEKDTEILDHLKEAVDQLDSLTERLKNVIETHEHEDEA